MPRDGVQLPGQPAALRLTARLAGAPMIAQPQLFVQLTDAAGIGYLLPAGPIARRRQAAHADRHDRAGQPGRLPAAADRLLAAVQLAEEEQAPDTLTLSGRVRAGQAGQHGRHLGARSRRPGSALISVRAAESGQPGADRDERASDRQTVAVSVTFKQGTRGEFVRQ